MKIEEAVNQFIRDGSCIGIGGFVNSRQPIALIHEIIRQKKANLTLFYQSSGLATEYLAGAMAVNDNYHCFKRMEFAYWGHESFGLSPLFRYFAEKGLLELEDWSNFNMSQRFKAAAMGLTFIPTNSPLGTDILKNNRAQIVECPFTSKPVALLPACHPDVALIHVQEADIYGNCRIKGSFFTCPEIAMASAKTIVTCEKIIEHEEMTRDSNSISIPFFAVDAVVEVPFGAYPGNCQGFYYFDKGHIKNYLAAAEAFRKGNREPLDNYFQNNIIGKSIDDFLDQIVYSQLLHVQQVECRTSDICV